MTVNAKDWQNCPQVSISTTFYKQLLHNQIPKAQKDINDLTVFFTLLGYECVKAAHKHVNEINPRHQFHQHFTLAFFVQKCSSGISIIKFWLCNFLSKEYQRKSCF